MPPPNVTGSLHMGHAQRATLEDALVRYHRMCGFNTLWQPGIDHAGIATQMVVERQLQREGKTRLELGRAEFEKRIWKWKDESGGRIAMQQRILGVSPDWPRSKFTMDPDLSKAVREAFVRLYEEGLMYRATRLINWCPECRTALSDLEVENEEGANGELFEFAYKVDGEDREIVVATTRPETMLGDTAVAVHPDDPRYTHLHGKKLKHPFVDRLVPVITDAILVDPKFGTGAVKVTPAHDFNDFATGKRHGLQEINILNLDGTLNENAGRFAGLDRKFARTAVKKALDELGLARGTKPHVLTLPRCSRSNGVVEPMISTQWFLKMEGMAKRAMEAIDRNDGPSANIPPHKTRIIPGEWVKTYDHFLANIQDWCVSRQLWWGHQIPAWHGPNGEIKVARERPAECTEANGWTQDPEVLDTWFSSGLWPFSTLGWPNATASLAKFYPTNPKQTSDLETGYDILFFWVARMMMFGLYFMKEVPFRRVLLSGLIVDETGDKMSKVKGNGVDPLDLIYGATFTDIVKKTLPGVPEAEAVAKFKKAYPSAAAMGDGFPAFGADAVRFTLACYPPSNQRIALALKKVEGNRHFLNKIWNATRLSLDLLDGWTWHESPAPKHLYNRWILSRLGRAIDIAHGGLDEFRVDEAANEAYRFFWTDVCDWYLELVKPILRKREDGTTADPALVEETKGTLAKVLETSLRLMAPLMPFITEELWQRLPKAPTKVASIGLAPYPESTEAPADKRADDDMTLLMNVISAARTIRSEHDVGFKTAVPLTIRSANEAALTVLRDNVGAFSFLVNPSGAPAFEGESDVREPGAAISVVSTSLGNQRGVVVQIGLKGIVSAADQKERLERSLKTVVKDLGAVDKKLGSKGFVDRAPKEVIDEANAQRAALFEKKARLEEELKRVDELN